MLLIKYFYDEIETENLWAKELELARFEYLKSGQKVDDNLYFIEEGAFRVFLLDDDGEEQTIRFGYGGEFITALDSFATGQSSDLLIQALTKSRVKLLPKKVFFTEVLRKQVSMEKWVELTLQMISQQIDREKDLLTNSPKKRLERVLTRSPQVFQKVPHKYIASYLRMTPETLSRIMKS